MTSRRSPGSPTSSPTPRHYRPIQSFFLLTGLFFAAIPQVFGQTGEPARAAVVVDGRDLFFVAGTSTVPATRRADAIADKIRALAEDPNYVPDSFTEQEAADRTSLVAGGTLILDVYDVDARLEGIGRAALVAAIRLRITDAVVAYRLERTSGYLIDNALGSLAATALLVALLLITRRLTRRVENWLESRYGEHAKQLEAKSFEIMRADQILATVETAGSTFWWVLAAVAGLIWLEFVCTRFPWTRGAEAWILGLALEPLRSMGAGLLGAIPDVAFLVILFLIANYLLKTLRVLFAGLASGAFTLERFPPEWAMPTYTLLRIGVVAVVAIVAFPHIPGSRSEAFTGLSIFAGVLVSLGGSSFIANTLAGYMLIYRRVFRLGDRVEIGEVIGDVIRIRLQVTHIRTIQNEEVIVPNSSILNREVVNYSSFARQQRLILHTTVSVGYEVPWRQVEALLVMAAGRAPRVLESPAPFVLERSLGEFAVTYELNAYSADASVMHLTHSELHRQILDVFNEYGVQIMVPAYEGDPDQPKIVRKDSWFEAPAEEGPAEEGGKQGSKSAGTGSD